MKHPDWIPAGVNPALWEALKEFHSRNRDTYLDRYDSRDDKSDLQPFTRTTTYPRGEE